MALTQGKPLPASHNFAYSSTAAMCAVLFSNPFDCLKTRMQLQGELMRRDAALARRYDSTADCARKTWAVEGVRGLQRGLSTAIVREGVLNFFRVGAFEPILKTLHSDPTPAPVWKRFAAGLCSGATAAWVANPLDLLKVRMQAQAAGANAAVGYQHGYRGVADGLRRVAREEGVTGMWKGATASVTRLGAGSASQLTVYTQLKEEMQHRGWADGPLLHVLCSVLGVFAGTVCMQPIDVVRTRVMNQPFGPDGRGLLYSGAADCALQTVRTEGPLAFFKGFVAHYMRGAPHVTLLFLFLEQLKRHRPIDAVLAAAGGAPAAAAVEPAAAAAR
eukprot:TRINITY_DN60307_c0_g1_i1.p1 TRINITY_DN60307_c0_g1~~TRINITY_DN60307_c0_g1_i1.p1  ORF type:complete len:359 (+),score=108.94 TRINITY_DN60307_c0_g1_i1:82-1077(+)